MLCNVKDTYTNTLFILFFTFRFVISHIAIESTFTTDSVGVSHPDSRPDPIGGSEPSSGRETMYWDFLPA